MSQSTLGNVELVMTNSNGEPPLVADVIRNLEAYGYKSEYSEGVPCSTAFRRAAKEFEAKDTKVTVWSSKADESLRGQLELLQEDEVTHRMSRTWVQSWEMVFDAEKRGFVLPSSGREFMDKFKEAKDRYVWGDVTSIVQRILEKDGLGSYSPRRHGVAYFVPTTSREQLDKLEAFCASISLHLLRFKIPDTEAQKIAIANAIGDSLDADCTLHQEAIDAYGEETKPGHIENRLEFLEQTRGMVAKLGEYLAAKANDLNQRLDTLVAAAKEKLAVAQTSRPAARVQRRVIAGVS